MDNIEKGLEILKDTILNNKTHKDYKRVTDLANEYFEIFTGAGIDKHLRNIVKREDKEMFDQRVKLYNTHIPATVNKALTTFNKVARSNRVYASIEHQNNKAKEEIQERIEAFWQGESESGLDAYIRQQWMYFITYDPNAFISVEFSNFDSNLEKTYPFPLSYTSKEVVNFQYINGSLEWAICKVPVQVIGDSSERANNGFKWTMYLDNSAIVLTEIDRVKRIVPPGVNGKIFELRDKNNIVQGVYVIEVFETKSQGVPLIRAGYIADPVTQNRTVVSILHPALSFFKDELKTGSEFALTMSLHVFPQKIMFGIPCPGNEEKGEACISGSDPNGGVCKRCKGSGVVPVHTSTQDVLEVRMPTNGEPLPDLNKFLVYKYPPIDLITFQEGFLERLSQKAIRAVFNNEDLSRNVKTATEIEYTEDNVQDTLFQCAQMYSTVWKFIVSKIAVYTDNSQGVVIYHQFAKDLKLKSIAQLMKEAKDAKDSGLSQHAITAINNDILEAYYADDQDTLTKLKIKDRFNPFSGKSEIEIQSILLGESVLPYYKYLYIYFNAIFNEIDNSYGEKFYLMNYQKQKGIVEEQVNVLMSQQQVLTTRIQIEDYDDQQ